MITISRLLAKQIRSVFRRALQLSASQTDQVVWLLADNTGLRIRAQNKQAIIEYQLPGLVTPDAVPITMEALAACEGTKADQFVSIERQTDGPIVLRWDDRAVPQSFVFDATKVKAEASPVPPEAWTTNAPSMLSALADAMRIVPAEATRHSLNCVHLRPDGGRIAATDSHHLLLQSGFEFPGSEDLLIPRTTLFSSRELPTDQSVEVGVTANHGVFRIGPWTVWLTLEKQSRYPRVEDIIPTAGSAKTRLSLSQEDRAFLLDVVPRLPSVTDQEDRVTLNLNGSVALLAQGDPPSPVTEVVLRNSHRSGDEVQLNTDRRFLVHAAQLGFQELEIHGPESPLVCRDEHRVYLWAPLQEMPPLTAGPDTVQIESPLTTNTTSHRPARHLPPPRRSRPIAERTPNRMSHNRISATLSGSTPPPEKGAARPIVAEAGNSPDQSASFGTVLREAESVKTSLREAHSQVSRLIAALKRHRRQSKLVQSTLSSLRQLQTLEV